MEKKTLNLERREKNFTPSLRERDSRNLERRALKLLLLFDKKITCNFFFFFFFFHFIATLAFHIKIVNMIFIFIFIF
jgi:hypothetical protein